MMELYVELYEVAMATSWDNWTRILYLPTWLLGGLVVAWIWEKIQGY